MTKRSHAPDIWDQDWFIALEPTYQLFYLFISDKASEAGIWRPNKISFEQSRKVRIDLYKFLDSVNSDEIRISVLTNNIWFINYHISNRHGNIYKPTNNWMNSAIKTALLSGVPVDWIKGFINHEKIDCDTILNSYIHRTTKYVNQTETQIATIVPITGETKIQVVASDKKQAYPQTRKIRISGAHPAFTMPEVEYSFDGRLQDINIEKWLQSHPFTKWIQNTSLRDQHEVKSGIEAFIKKAQGTSKLRAEEELSDWFNNWATNERVHTIILTNENNSSEERSPESNGFSGLKKYEKKKG